MKQKLYAERDAIALGQLYVDHVCAMTSEALHEKSDIAAELAWRDARIQMLQEDRDHVAAKLKRAQAENIRLLRNFINQNSTVFTTHCVPEDFQGD